MTSVARWAEMQTHSPGHTHAHIHDQCSFHPRILSRVQISFTRAEWHNLWKTKNIFVWIHFARQEHQQHPLLTPPPLSVHLSRAVVIIDEIFIFGCLSRWMRFCITTLNFVVLLFTSVFLRSKLASGFVFRFVLQHIFCTWNEHNVYTMHMRVHLEFPHMLNVWHIWRFCLQNFFNQNSTEKTQPKHHKVIAPFRQVAPVFS